MKLKRSFAITFQTPHWCHCPTCVLLIIPNQTVPLTFCLIPVSVTLKSPSGVSLPLGTRIYELPLLYSGTSFTELTRVPTSWAETRNRGSNVAISTRQTILAHPCPPELDLMNMVIMGNHSINAARSNFLWFSPRYQPPSDSISTDSTTMKWIFFSHP